MTRLLVLCLVLGLGGTGTARAAERTLSSLDFLVDGASLVDSTVHITRCNIANASTLALLCYAYPAGNMKSRVGWITIDSATLDREDLRKALNLCFDMAIKPACWVDITGTPVFRFPTQPNPEIKNAKLDWVKP